MVRAGPSIIVLFGAIALACATAPAALGGGGDCTSADGVTIHSGQSVVTTAQGGHQQSIFFACRDGTWLFNGVTPVAPPIFGSDYRVVNR